jgi:peptide/nickel transport system substrate-binding protein
MLAISKKEEDMSNSTARMTRRQFLAAAGMIASSIALASCGATPTATPVPPTATKPAAAAPTTAPAAAAPTATKAAAAAAPTTAPAAAGDPKARVIRKILLVAQDNGSDAKEYEMAKFTVEAMRGLGIDVDVNAMPYEQQSDLVWYKRDQWDFTMWQMAGRAERSDPDELLYNLYVASTAKDGYNFVGYINPDYEKVAEAQRAEPDPAKRAVLVKQCQDILNNDQPYVNYVHQMMDYVYNNAVWDSTTISDQAGIGAKNFWTFVNAKPKGDVKDMVLVSGPNITAINPLYISGATDSWITELVWDRLMRIGSDGVPKPWAAEKVTWVDGKTVDITLRQNMKWHDGKPVTIDDVIFSYQTPMGDKVPMYKPFVSRIASITKTGDWTCRILLSAAYVPFETASLAKINLVPKHIWDPIIQGMAGKPDTAEKYQETTPIGSGPFKFVAWKQSQEVNLQANPDHFNAPKMNRWVLRFVANPEAVLGMMHSGELNFISFYAGAPDLLLSEVQKDSKLSVMSTIELGSRFLAMNERRPPFDDVWFRKAVSMTIDKQGIVQGIYKSRAVASNSIIGPGMKAWYNDKLAPIVVDVKAAKQLLKDHGYEWDASGKLMYPAGKTETLVSK